MKFLKLFLIIFISLSSSIKADFNEKLFNQLEDGGKLIFIRHAYAPGSGDPSNFNLNDCSTQRNLSDKGRSQAKKIGNFFKENYIDIDKVLSSEWCRCKETADLAFNNYITKNFLNSFYSSKFAKNRNKQIKDLKRFINEWDGNKNLVLITHYVLISELLNYAPSSGEMVISNKNFKLINTYSLKY